MCVSEYLHSTMTLSFSVCSSPSCCIFCVVYVGGFSDSLLVRGSSGSKRQFTDGAICWGDRLECWVKEAYTYRNPKDRWLMDSRRQDSRTWHWPDWPQDYTCTPKIGHYWTVEGNDWTKIPGHWPGWPQRAMTGPRSRDTDLADHRATPTAEVK